MQLAEEMHNLLGTWFCVWLSEGQSVSIAACQCQWHSISQVLYIPQTGRNPYLWKIDEMFSFAGYFGTESCSIIRTEWVTENLQIQTRNIHVNTLTACICDIHFPLLAIKSTQGKNLDQSPEACDVCGVWETFRWTYTPNLVTESSSYT